MKTIRSYTQLITYTTILERYKYLRLSGQVGRETFGSDRYFNQSFYKSKEWLDVRNYVIVRDNGFDLGLSDYPISGRILIHHMNPISVLSLRSKDPTILDPEFLISCSEQTHQAIHYGSEQLLPQTIVFRKPNDTTLW